MSTTNVTLVMNKALDLRKSGDGRLGAIIDRSILHVRKAFPGFYKQADRSATVRAQIDREVWSHAKHRVTRYLKNNKITLPLV